MFTWLTGSDSTYRNWADGFPKQDNRCVQMQENGEWISQPCSGEDAPYDKFICEKSMLS